MDHFAGNEAALRVRKFVSKRKAEIPLDELLAAHTAGDNWLETLMGRYSGSVVPASTRGAKSVKEPKPTKNGSKKTSGARLARLDDSRVVHVSGHRQNLWLPLAASALFVRRSHTCADRIFYGRQVLRTVRRSLHAYLLRRTSYT